MTCSKSLLVNISVQHENNWKLNYSNDLRKCLDLFSPSVSTMLKLHGKLRILDILSIK